jgi:hypothetical protein
MPSNHWITDTFLVVEMNGTTAGATAQSVGLNIVKRVTVRHSDLVQEFDYAPTMSYVLSQLSATEQDQVRDKMIGGLGSAAETVLVPLPVWWGKFGQGKFIENNQGLPAFLLNSPVELELELNPDSKLLGSGGTFAANGYDTLKVVHLVKKSTTEVYSGFRGKPWSYVGYDYQTIRGFALPDGATTEMDLTAFDGSSAGLYFNPISDNDIALGNLYTITEFIDRIETFINSSSYLQLTSNISPNDCEPAMQYLAWAFGSTAGKGQMFTGGVSGPFVPFGGSLEPGDDSSAVTSPKFVGSFNLRDATRLTVQIRNSSGGAATTDALNIRYAQFTIVDGDLRRVK